MGTLLTRLPTQHIILQGKRHRYSMPVISEPDTHESDLGLGLPGPHGRVGKRGTTMEPNDDRDRGTGSIANRARAPKQTSNFEVLTLPQY